MQAENSSSEFNTTSFLKSSETASISSMLAFFLLPNDALQLCVFQLPGEPIYTVALELLKWEHASCVSTCAHTHAHRALKPCGWFSWKRKSWLVLLSACLMQSKHSIDLEHVPCAPVLLAALKAIQSTPSNVYGAYTSEGYISRKGN